MGTIRHNAIIVTGGDRSYLLRVRHKAKEIFATEFKKLPASYDIKYLFSAVLNGVVNSQFSFFIAPDGSKEGWAPSNAADDARNIFFNWLVENPHLYDTVIEIEFGGDNKHGKDGNRVIRYN